METQGTEALGPQGEISTSWGRGCLFCQVLSWASRHCAQPCTLVLFFCMRLQMHKLHYCCVSGNISYVLLVRIRNVPLMTIHYLPIVPRSFLHAEQRRDVVDVGCHFQVCKRLGAWKVFWLYSLWAQNGLVLGTHGSLWAHMGSFSAHMGPLWAQMGSLWAEMGSLWAQMGSLWA